MADTKIVIFNADKQSAFIDYRTEATNSEGRQVIVVGDPSVNANVAAVKSEDVGSSSTEYGLVVRLAGSAQVNAVAGTLGVNLGKVDGTIQVNVGKIDDNVSVKFATISGTAGVNLGKVDGTIQTNVGKIDDVVSVRMNSIAGTVGVNLGKVDGTIQVDVGKINDSVALKAGTNNIGDVDVASIAAGDNNIGNVDIVSGTLTNITNTVAVYFDRGDPGVKVTSGTLTNITDTVKVRIDPGHNVVNIGSTISLPVTVSTTTSGISASGVQVVAPEAGHNIKVFAYSVQTTGAVSMAIKFTNGAGTSPTEFWRPLVTAGGVTGVQGANLAVSPPGYLFATGVNTTLAIVNDSASLIHYSVAYFKESA